MNASRRHILIPLSLLLLFCASFFCTSVAQAQAATSKPDLVLKGDVVGKQNNTYVVVPFKVPSGTHRVTLHFSYTGREEHAVLDLGMRDTVGLRCWSGGNKSVLTVSLADATPSCLAGPITAGTWSVLIGVPNIRPQSTAHFTAELYFTRTGLVADEPAMLRAPIRSGPAWYRGDLHMHTAHSDGSCASQSGASVPCPVFLTVEAAARRGLDFIALTDHNTTTHYEAMRELAPYFDKLLLIPGREITTFHGHANIFGTEDFLDFRLGSPAVPDMNTLLRRSQALGAVFSINHPGAPTGERCMGCGWNPSPPADMRLVSAVEAVNSGSEQGPYSGIPFWEKQLDSGFRLTAIGGSDNHNAPKPLDQVGSIGSPTTVVYAGDLSTPAILAAIRAGHVFIDLTASRDKLLEVRAGSGDSVASMGDELAAKSGAQVHFEIHTVHAEGGELTLLQDGSPLKDAQWKLSAADTTSSFDWTSDDKRHWIRADVHGPDGKLWLLGNPIYVNWEAATKSGEAQ
ncbi:MAG TPA: CehA/McbA family metallohydrolase [Acidisarcina sp.]|nr:CehA/McbA family metallohydrolase [Acidisarcina sp.]